MSFDIPSIAQYTPEATVFIGVILVFMLDVAGIRSRAIIGGATSIFLLLAFLQVLADLGSWPLQGLSTLPAGLLGTQNGPVIFTNFGLIFQGIFLLSALLVALASVSEADGEEVPTFYALLSLAALGMLFVAISADLIFLLLSVEITGIATYVMVGYTRKDRRAVEAAMKFYIIGALSTAISFFGASLLYGAYGTTSLTAFRALPANSSLALVGFGMVAVGLGFKATLVPFHMWAVDVYDGAPASVSAFLAAGSKKMGLFGIFIVFVAAVRIFASAQGFALYLALGALAVITMTVGNVMALEQTTMKRMLAYSSIAQAGYMLLGIAIDTPAALAGATLQITADVLMKAGAFIVVGAAVGLGVGPLITDWRGVGHSRPGIGASFAIMLLSLAGMPLTLGFVGKFYLFFAAVEAGGYFTLLAIAGLLNSALSVFYYARILRYMYMPESTGSATAGAHPLSHSSLGVGNAPAAPAWGSVRDEIRGTGSARWATVVGIALLLLVLGIYPTPLIGAMNSAAQQFLTLGL
jgi:NADH-quinone oxidoreductase subunit N